MRYLALLLVMLISGEISGQLIYETVWVDYDSAWEYKGMQIVPIRPKDPGGSRGPRIISLSSAIRQGIAQVSERGSASTENVHWLRINNRSDQIIFVAAGQILTGGRQDRIITADTLLAPTGQDQYMPVMCVEEGRWSAKEKKFLYGNYANLGLRKVLDRSRNQVLVWKEIFAQLDSADFNSPTFAYAALQQNKSLKEREEPYFNFFKEKFKNTDSSILGFVCITGNRVVGADIFANALMFYDEMEPLLYGYIHEVLRDGSEPLLDKDQIKEYMDKLLTNETLQAAYCREHGKIFRSGGKVIHLTAY